MSTSDGLKLAMEMDKKGSRTLGVITKVKNISNFNDKISNFIFNVFIDRYYG